MRTKVEAVAHPFAATASASSNAVARFGFLVFLASESMLFAGLLAALAVFRSRCTAGRRSDCRAYRSP